MQTQENFDFSFSDFDVGVVIEKYKVIHTDIYVHLTPTDRFELYDLYETLSELNDVVITNEKLCKILKDMEVITSCGNKRWGYGAGKGHRFDEFFKIIENLCDKYIFGDEVNICLEE